MIWGGGAGVRRWGWGGGGAAESGVWYFRKNTDTATSFISTMIDWIASLLLLLKPDKCCLRHLAAVCGEQVCAGCPASVSVSVSVCIECVFSDIFSARSRFVKDQESSSTTFC